MAPIQNTGGDEVLCFGSVSAIFEKIRAAWFSVYKYPPLYLIY